MSETAQQTLIPEEMPVGSPLWLDVERCYAGPGIPPSQQLIDSVGRIGVLQPVIAVDLHDGNYKIIDGRRRWLSAIQSDLLQIPALVFTNMDEATQAVIQLATHGNRSRNPVAEYMAVKVLLDEGASMRDIARETGMTSSEIKARMRLEALDERLLDAFVDGSMPVSAATEAAKLPPEMQAYLVVQLEDAGRIKISDVHEAKRARTRQAVAALASQDLFGGPTNDVVEEQQSQADALCDSLDAALRAGDTAKARSVLAELRAAIR